MSGVSEGNKLTFDGLVNPLMECKTKWDYQPTLY